MNAVRSPIRSSSNPNLLNMDIESKSKPTNMGPRKRKFDNVVDNSYVAALKSFKDEMLECFVQIRAENDMKIDKLSESINTCIKEELCKLTTCFGELKSSLEHTDAELQNTNKRVSELEKRDVHIKNLEFQLVEMNSTVSQLKRDNRQQQQWARQLNVELVGIPESKDENLQDIVFRLAEHVGITLTANDIDNTTRVQPMNRDSKRPRNIIIKMKQRKHKDNFIAGVRKHRGITSAAIGMPGEPSKIYANDHLIPENKLLLKSCRNLASQNGFSYVWVKNGRIYVRRNDTCPAFLIDSEVDLRKIV